MEQKKQTKAQLEKRIQNAVMFVPKDKDTESVFFSDKGLRLTATIDNVVIATNYHSHVFANYTASGISRPYLYTKRIIEIAKENDCETDDGYSYAKLLETLKAKDDKAEYNIAYFYGWWCVNCFQPLYSIGESDVEAFIVYENYLHNVACNSILLSEKTEDITNKQFVEKVTQALKEYVADAEEVVVFKKKSDEELMKENIDAIQEQENEDVIKQINDESKD